MELRALEATLTFTFVYRGYWTFQQVFVSTYAAFAKYLHSAKLSCQSVANQVTKYKTTSFKLVMLALSAPAHDARSMKQNNCMDVCITNRPSSITLEISVREFELQVDTDSNKKNVKNVHNTQQSVFMFSTLLQCIFLFFHQRPLPSSITNQTLKFQLDAAASSHPCSCCEFKASLAHQC